MKGVRRDDVADKLGLVGSQEGGAKRAEVGVKKVLQFNPRWKSTLALNYAVHKKLSSLCDMSALALELAVLLTNVRISCLGISNNRFAFSAGIVEKSSLYYNH